MIELLTVRNLNSCFVAELTTFLFSFLFRWVREEPGSSGRKHPCPPHTVTRPPADISWPLFKRKFTLPVPFQILDLNSIYGTQEHKEFCLSTVLSLALWFTLAALPPPPEKRMTSFLRIHTILEEKLQKGDDILSFLLFIENIFCALHEVA